ncbi:MAG: NACHT domain-containing NTPase [Cyanobacteria bacterium P01_A01_bin.135]
MAKRSLTACPAGIETATTALTDRGWSREDLAARVVIEGKSRATTGVGIGTVKRFFGSGSLDRKYFVGICRALGLDWEAIAGKKGAEPGKGSGAGSEAEGRSPSELPQQASVIYDLRGAKFGGGAAMGGVHQSGGILNDYSGSKGASALDIDALVQTVREKVHDNIQQRCGTMRVLDMNHPIDLTDIYTSVNILEKITGRRRLGRNELLQNLDLEYFDHFMLSDILEKRIPVLAAVEAHDRLIILGKPGAGKTTLLKRLATLCNRGQLQSDAVPVFVTLKDFAETEDELDLLLYIGQQLEQYGVEDGAIAAKTLLQEGRALVLLDGLDEVPESDHKRVIRDIRGIYERFTGCQFVITCRIAAQEYTFEPFVEVEVADFDNKQITEFVAKWFQIQENPVKAQTFLKRLENDRPIRLLARTPLLLTLLCLVFQDAADFPRNRSRLYKEMLDMLLKKWDAKRNIERDQVYKALSLQRKEDLLSHVAFEAFKRGEHSFEQGDIERQIQGYIQNLPEVSTDLDFLQLDSEVVLKSIEAQHGLLVERRRGTYSFSHPTFHEYFTASYIASLNPDNLQQRLKNMAANITEKRWREVFLLVPEMIRSADYLVRLMKQEADQLLARDEKLQQVIAWVRTKQLSVNAQDIGFEVRKFYFNRVLDLDFYRKQDPTLSLALALYRDIELAIWLELYRNPYRALELELESYYGLGQAFTLDCDRAPEFTLNRILGRAYSFNDPTRFLNSSLVEGAVEGLRDQLPIPKGDRSEFRQWWQSNGKAWTEQLRAVMIDHRNIGHDWQFTSEQKALLEQYYDANQLLIECLNSDCYITRDVREEIEDTLFLPIAEIEARKAKP